MNGPGQIVKGTVPHGLARHPWVVNVSSADAQNLTDGPGSEPVADGFAPDRHGQG